MTLPSDLVSQFAKITNDSGIKKEETILYGKVVQYEDSLCVRLDGSNEITPAVTTSTIKAGDRVSVTLKNHTAIITGNLSDPAASGDDVKKVKMEITDMGVVFTGLADGTTIINGACIKTGTIDAERINLKGTIISQFSVNGGSDWHEDMTESDMYRRDSLDGGVTWGTAYQFRGKNGSDANVPSYIRSTYIDGTRVSSFHIQGNKIEVVMPYGSESDDVGFILTDTFNDKTYQYLRIYGYDSGMSPTTVFESPCSGSAEWRFNSSYFTGLCQFAGDVQFGGETKGVKAYFA